MHTCHMPPYCVLMITIIYTVNDLTLAYYYMMCGEHGMSDYVYSIYKCTCTHMRTLISTIINE